MSDDIRARAERLSELDAVIAAEVVARQMVTQHIFEDFHINVENPSTCGHTKFEGSPPCPCDRQNTTENGIDLTGLDSVGLVDYGMLKERARIVNLLTAPGVEWHSFGVGVCEPGCCNCYAIQLIEGVDK